MLTINIIGAGAVGQTLGHLLVEHQVASIKSVLNQSAASSHSAIEWMGQGHVCQTLAELLPADIILLTVPDQQISMIAERLSHSPNLRSGTIVLHCSGALNSQALGSLRSKNCILASLHPALSFTDPKLAVTQFANTLCALEGDAAAKAILQPLFTAIGATVYEIQAEQKTLYHLAAVFVTNYTVALSQQAYEQFLAAGLSQSQAKQLTDKFLTNVSENIEQAYEPKQALTGPLQRGDKVTIESHLQILQDPNARALYVSLAKATLAMTTLDEVTMQTLKNLLLSTPTSSS